MDIAGEFRCYLWRVGVTDWHLVVGGPAFVTELANSRYMLVKRSMRHYCPTFEDWVERVNAALEMPPFELGRVQTLTEAVEAEAQTVRLYSTRCASLLTGMAALPARRGRRGSSGAEVSAHSLVGGRRWESGPEDPEGR